MLVQAQVAPGYCRRAEFSLLQLMVHTRFLRATDDKDSDENVAMFSPALIPLPFKVRAHVAANGCLAFFPEAKLNRTPEVLCTFRRGLFALAEEHNVAVVSLTNVGNQAAWPVDSAVGGLPARITMKLTEIVQAGHGLSAEEIRLKAEVSMQADVTSMLEERGDLKSKES